MGIRATVFVVMGIVGVASAGQTYTETMDIYTVLDGREPGPPSAVWIHTFDGSVSPITGATLSIICEGVDTGEDDPVYFEGHFLGLLQDQGFYYSGWDIQAGPGALGFPKTELTASVFDLDPSWIAGLTTARVQVETNWIMEVETSTLAIVPEPATLALLGCASAWLLRCRPARRARPPSRHGSGGPAVRTVLSGLAVAAALPTPPVLVPPAAELSEPLGQQPLP